MQLAASKLQFRHAVFGRSRISATCRRLCRQLGQLLSKIAFFRASRSRLSLSSGSLQVCQDELIGFMCLVSAAKLEFVIGITGGMDTYIAAGKKATPGE